MLSVFMQGQIGDYYQLLIPKNIMLIYTSEIQGPLFSPSGASYSARNIASEISVDIRNVPYGPPYHPLFISDWPKIGAITKCIDQYLCNQTKIPLSYSLDWLITNRLIV